MGKKKAGEETAKTVEAQDSETAGVVSQTDLTSTDLYDMQQKLDEQQRLIEDLTLGLSKGCFLLVKNL